MPPRAPQEPPGNRQEAAKVLPPWARKYASHYTLIHWLTSTLVEHPVYGKLDARPPDPQKIHFYWGRVAGGCFNVVQLRLAFPIRGDILVFVSSGRPGGPKQKKSGLESGCLEYSMRENGKTKEYRVLHNLDFFPIQGTREQEPRPSTV